MQIKETLDVSFPGAVESPPLEGVVVLADSAGVALGGQRTFSARVRSVRDDGSGLIAARCVEIPLLGPEGEVSGILCHTAGAAREFVAIVVADGGEGMAEEVLIEGERGAVTLVRVFLPRVRVGGVPSSSLAGTEIVYTPSPSGGIFHVVNPATAPPTS
jgi:hypothetical protein